MPDQLNKQAVVNLLIDSPLREPIKINLIDIVNNTPDPDLSKVFPTIVKELEIFQKATERRMKLADETITKLGGQSAPESPVVESSATSTASAPSPSLPPMPDMPTLSTDAPMTPPTPPTPAPSEGLVAPSLDLPPLPTAPTAPVPETASAVSPAPTPTPEPVTTMPTDTPAPDAAPLPSPTPLGGAPATAQGDEAALAEIQKELDSLKSSTASEVTAAAAPAPQA